MASETKQEAAEERAPQPVVAGIDTKELVALVAATVGEVLKPFLEKLSRTGIDTEQLGASIGRNVASGIAQTQRRKVTFGEYIAKPHSPNRQTITLKLSRPTFQNGFWLSDATLTDDEISMLNSITHGGRYCDRFVEVGIGVNGMDQELHITFPNATADDRIRFRDHIHFDPRKHKTPFEAMLMEVLAVQAEEREERDVEAEMRREVSAVARERLLAKKEGRSPVTVKGAKHPNQGTFMKTKQENASA